MTVKGKKPKNETMRKSIRFSVVVKNTINANGISVSPFFISPSVLKSVF